MSIQTYPTTFTCSRPTPTRHRTIRPRRPTSPGSTRCSPTTPTTGSLSFPTVGRAARRTRHRGPFQLRALPAGHKLRLRDGRSRVPFLHDQCRRLAERHRDHSLRRGPRDRADPLGRLHGHAASGRQYLVRHGAHALLQPVRHHRADRCDSQVIHHRHPRSPSRAAWPAEWGAREPRRSSSSRPTAWRTHGHRQPGQYQQLQLLQDSI